MKKIRTGREKLSLFTQNSSACGRKKKMTLLLSPRGILSNRNLPKMVTEERKIKARGQTTFAPLALFTSTRFCWIRYRSTTFPSFRDPMYW